MADPYRIAPKQPLWSVTYRRPLFTYGPYTSISCTEFGIEARDALEAIEKATKDEGEPFVVIDVHQLPIPVPSPGTQEKT
jgi:hypothetical protein